MKLEFDPMADAAYVEISSAQVERTEEIEPGINADYDAEGHLVGRVARQDPPLPPDPLRDASAR